MKFSTKRTVSAALAAVTVLTTALTSAFAFGASVSAAKDPKDIDRVVVDCRTAESFAKTSYVHVHKPTDIEPDPYTGGKYSFHKGMNAMSVDYNSGAPKGREYRILTNFNAKGSLTEEYKYMVIVYAAKTTQPYRLSVWNGGGQGPEVNFVTDGKNTNAKFAITEPFDISKADAQGRSTLKRWINGPHGTIAFITGEKNASFFIKEYSFFKSPEDAKAYYAAVDLNKDPMEYGENAVKPAAAPAASSTPTTSAPTAEVEVAPVYVSFASKEDLERNAQCRVFGGENEGLGGLQEYATAPDGTPAIKILKHKYTGKASAGSSDYRIMLAFKGKGYISENHKYARITYMTTNKEANSITLANNASGKCAVLVSDTSVSKGKFVTSGPVDVQATGLVTRFAAANHCALEYKNTSKNPEIYIKEIVFFGTKAQAEAYDPSKPFDLSTEFKPTGSAPAAPSTPAPAADPNNNVFNVNYTVVEEATASKPTSDAAPVIMDFSTKANLMKTALLRNWTGENEKLGGIQEFVTLPDGTQCMKLLPHKYTGKASAGSSAYYRMMPYFTVANTVTEAHKYVRIVYMTTDIAPRNITLTNNASGQKAVLVANTAASRGEFVISAPVDISLAGLNTRYAKATHCAFEYHSYVENSNIYIKEMGFFTSPEQAYEYYGDELDNSKIQYVELSLGTAGTGLVKRGVNWGNSTDTDDSVVVEYLEKGEWNNVHYRVDIAARSKSVLSIAGKYIRVLYSAQNPADVKKASLFIQNNKTGLKFKLSDNVVNTNGEFVLSDVGLVDDDTFARFSNVQNAFMFNALSEGGRYEIKSVYFFNTREEAEAFKFIDEKTVLTINGNDIAKYQIVIPEVTPDNVAGAAVKMSVAIKRLTGIDVPVVTDDVPASGYEILIGKTNRPMSAQYLAEALKVGENAYGFYVDGSNVAVVADLGLALVTGIDAANKALFFDTYVGIPAEANITSELNITDIDKTYLKVSYWNDPEPVANPTVFTEDFDADDGYFNEDNGEKNWSYADGAYKTNATDYASSYLHVYEKNVFYKAKLSYTAENDGNMGILARVNSKWAYIKAGYDFEDGVWYVEYRDGRDNFIERTATKAAELAPNTVYELILNVDGENVSLTVNGEAVIVNAPVKHYSPGRLGMYAENASVSVDDVEITLVSGQGTIFSGVYHTMLPYDSYIEGGTVHQRADGSLDFVHPYGVSYKSYDGGKSWQESERWSDNWNWGYSNMIRLNNGSFLRVGQETVNGGLYKVARISTDDGETWGQPYPICDGKYKKNTVAQGSNMNDKVLQFPENSKYPNRIFYCQTYEVNSSWSGGIKDVEGRIVSGQFFYSDDNGVTWTKSETDTWTIPGLETEKYVSECKILICEDGTVRMYCSWNQLGYIVYSDSNDGGVTFGPVQYMYDFQCPASSMQFVRDPYADNDYTYYMVWPNGEVASNAWHHPRSRLSLAKTTNGKDWVYLGDIWRWESTWGVGSTLLHHIVDPFIYVTEDYVIAGSGFSEGRKLAGEGGPDGHQGQRQHIFTIRKDTLPEGTTEVPVMD